MHDSTAAGRMTEAKAKHLSFDILEQKKTKTGKNREEEGKKLGSKVCSEKHDWSAMTFAAT